VGLLGGNSELPKPKMLETAPASGEVLSELLRDELRALLPSELLPSELLFSEG
jgi:hypothetical protein